MRTGPLATAGWLVAAALTLGVSWSAVEVVRGAVAPEELTVAADGLPAPDETTGPATAPSATPTGGPSRSPTAPSPTPPAGRTVSASGTGGTIIVRCEGGVPRLVGSVPRQGFAVEVDDSSVEVKFTSESHRTEMKATCSGTEPRITKEEDDRGGGDNSGRGGGNSGPGGGDSGGG